MCGLVLCCCQPGVGQVIDFAEYTRYADPPSHADFVSQSGDDTTRIVYTPGFSFKGVQALKVETKETDTSGEPGSSLFVQATENEIILVGLVFASEEIGVVDALLDPPVSFPRHVEVGQEVTRSSESRVLMGPVPATVTLSVTFKYLETETVDVPMGRFENSLRTEVVKSASLFGVELITLRTIEWYHPLVGLLKTTNPESGDTDALTAIEPPVEIPSCINDWFHFRK